MAIRTEDTIKAVEKYAELIQRNWKKRIVPLRGWKACKFFIGVMLDQRQDVDRQWAAAEDFVDNRRYDFCPPQVTPRTFWGHVAKLHLNNRNIFTFTEGNESGNKTYAALNCNKFPAWLKNNANKIIEDYDSLVENIWESDLPDDNEKKIEELHKRFKDFEGIGQNLANMAVFALVRDHGYAGGWESRNYLKIKADTHVQHVYTRAFLHGNSQPANVEGYVKELNSQVESPADIDFALFTIGKEYCQKEHEKCIECPIHEACNFYTVGGSNS